MTMFFLVSETTLTHLPRVKSYEQATMLYASIHDVRDMTDTRMYAFEADGAAESSEPVWQIIDPHCNWTREESPLHKYGIGLSGGISQRRLDNALERIEELQDAISSFTSSYENQLSRVERALSDMPSHDDLPSDDYEDDEDA